MLGLMALTFVAGCIVGAALNDLARWQKQRSAAQNLLRALDAGTVYFGRNRLGLTVEQESNDRT